MRASSSFHRNFERRDIGLNKYEPGLSSHQNPAAKAVLDLAWAKRSPFDANEALTAVLKSGPGMNPETVTLLLDDLTDAGFVRQLPGGEQPDKRPRWELVARTLPPAG